MLKILTSLSLCVALSAQGTNIDTNSQTTAHFDYNYEEESAGEDTDDSWSDIMEVHYQGDKPTIVDFINALVDNLWSEEGESECDYWMGDWQKYQRTHKAAGTEKYTVDKPNGYVRIESKPDKNMELFYDFCFWNCDDGKHQLFSISSGILEKGKPLMTECFGISFYLYDNDTHMLSYLGMEEAAFGEMPTQTIERVYLLPRTGKDIIYIDGNGKRGTLPWNGFGFGTYRIEH